MCPYLQSVTINNMQIYIPALSALLGVFIGAIVSMYVARLQFRANVVSKYRQDWIRELRDTIADYQSIVGRLGLMKYARADGETHKDVRDTIERLILTSNKIALMLDLSDSRQNKLHSLMIQIRVVLEKLEKEENFDTIAALANQINDVSRDIFLSEYGKAKQGK